MCLQDQGQSSGVWDFRGLGLRGIYGAPLEIDDGYPGIGGIHPVRSDQLPQSPVDGGPQASAASSMNHPYLLMSPENRIIDERVEGGEGFDSGHPVQVELRRGVGAAGWMRRGRLGLSRQSRGSAFLLRYGGNLRLAYDERLALDLDHVPSTVPNLAHHTGPETCDMDVIAGRERHRDV